MQSPFHNGRSGEPGFEVTHVPADAESLGPIFHDIDVSLDGASCDGVTRVEASPCALG